MNYPLIILAFIWLIGLLLGTNITLSKAIFILLLISIVIFGLSFFFYYRRFRAWFLLLIISVLILAIVRMNWYQNTNYSKISEEIISENAELGLRGYIASEPTIDGNLVKFTVKPISYYLNDNEQNLITKEKILIYLYLKEKEEMKIVDDWHNGMGISLYGQIDQPMTARNPGQFDYQKYLERNNIYWQLKVYDFSKIKISEGKKLITGYQSIKNYLADRIEATYVNPYAGFMKAIILGDRQDLTIDVKEDFSTLGLSHLLAISGLHLSILTMLLFWIIIKIGLTRENTAFIVGFLLLAYMVITGLSASVVRATMMTVLMLYGIIFKRSLLSIQTIALVFLGMTIYNPVWIFDIGFQLSFIVTFFILWGLPYINELLPIKHSTIKNAISLLLVTQLASFPLIFYNFHQYSILSWVANFLLVPVFSIVILPLGIITFILSILQLNISFLFAAIISGILNILFKLIHLTADFPYFQYYGSLSSFYWAITFYFIVVWFLIRKSIKEAFISFSLKKYIFIFEKVAIITLVLIMVWSFLPRKEGVVTFIDVGQGDSIFIQTPEGKNILIDSGGTYNYEKEQWQQRKNPFEVGEDVILPYLRYRGIKELDLAIITHEDFDHLGGFFSLVEKVKIKTFIVSKNFPRTEAGLKLKEILDDKNIKIEHIDNVKSLKLSSITQLTFLPVDIKESEKENDHSFLIDLEMYQTKIAFSADLEEIGERMIIQNYLLMPTDILKVGHHGSNTSTSIEWLNYMQPKHAIISVGERNRYNHPSEEVIERLVADNSTIWRTDRDGAILVLINKDGYDIRRTLK